MRLFIFSDLHLEDAPQWDFPTEVPDFDVAVVAGDVASSVSISVKILAEAPILTGKPVVLVAGNHEFDHSVLQDNLAAGLAEAEDHHPNIHVLHRRSIVIGGVRFIGATLWTDYELYGSTRDSMIYAGQTMPDHDVIRYREPDGHISRFMPWHTRAEHFLDRGFIADTLAFPHDGPTVVVTHHLPTPRSVAPRFVGHPLSPAFASNLEPTIIAARPACWVHGHAHHSCDYRIGGTRVVSNPKGYGPYPKKFRTDNDRFDPRLVVEVPSASDALALGEFL